MSAEVVVEKFDGLVGSFAELEEFLNSAAEVLESMAR